MRGVGGVGDGVRVGERVKIGVKLRLGLGSGSGLGLRSGIRSKLGLVILGLRLGLRSMEKPTQTSVGVGHAMEVGVVVGDRVWVEVEVRVCDVVEIGVVRI